MSQRIISRHGVGARLATGRHPEGGRSLPPGLATRRQVLASLGAAGLLTALPAVKPARAAAGPLTVQGNQLLADGVPVRLRGLALGDSTQARAGRPISDLAVCADQWHANVVRLAVVPSDFRDRTSQCLAALDRDVQAALAQGMWVIIDWHVVGWPDGWSEWPEMITDWSLCRTFWTVMRDIYGSDGRIVFELWNEPLSSFAWGDPNDATWPEQRARFAQLVDLIRRSSANVIICSGDWNSFDLRGIRAHPIPGGNIAYAWHVYPIEGRADVPRWSAMLDDLDGVAPVIVTEWGFSADPKDADEHFHGTAASFGDPLVAFLNQRGLHWTSWCWHPEYGPRMLEDDWRTPTTFGAFVQAQLAADR
jgi:hypothetical protein